MADPLRHPLTPTQQKQIASLNAAVQNAQNRVGLYLQAIVDGINAPEGVQWGIDGDALVGTPPGPALVK